MVGRFAGPLPNGTQMTNAAWTCANCEHTSENDFNFCPNCGAARRRDAEAVVPVESAATTRPDPLSVTPKKSKWPLVLAALVVLVGLGVAAFLLFRPGPTHTLTGNITVIDTGDCTLSEGYDDIEAGLDVVVENDEGKTIGVGDLQEGEEKEYGCDFAFEVVNVEDSPIYSVSVGNRGTTRYDAEDMEDSGWTVDLTLGG
jgi:hypothetical protein